MSSHAPFTIALINPEIPPNTGNIARLCGATTCRLDIVGKPAFDLSDKALKRAGLDYWHLVDIHHFPDIMSYLKQKDPSTLHFFSSKTQKSYIDAQFQLHDTLLFGSETKGLSQEIWEHFPTRFVTIPMFTKEQGMRSINLATSVGIGLYEAIRQTNYKSPTASI